MVILVASVSFADTTRPSVQPRSPTTQRIVVSHRQAATLGNALSEALKPAIDALTAEFEQAMRSPEHAVLRTACDYFDNHSATVAASSILDALTRRLNRDPRIDVYVKWQLLSAQKKPFTGDDADRAMQLYVRSLPPPARPGTSAIDQRRLTAEIGQIKQPDVEAYNANFDQTLRINDLQFAAFWGIRDALYARIPKDYDTFKTAFVDADQRLQGGYDAKPFLKMLYADIRAWGMQAKKNDVQRMSDLVQSYATREPTHRFTEIAFSDKKQSASWHTSSTRFDKKACETLASDLRHIANAGF